MSTSANDGPLVELRKKEIDRLSKLPEYPDSPVEEARGVLLSDRIKVYCEQYQLIGPFEEERLRPAGYVLTVGRRCSILGEQKALDHGVPLTIGPYQVAIIETFETINMPKYLIGRWNVQTKRAYQGLLWVGGAQVDPGFRGYLCCPIYNLSTESVTLAFRDSLAVMDFVPTTLYTVGQCKDFPWAERNMLVFGEYPKFKSGIEAEVEAVKTSLVKNIKLTEDRLNTATTKTQEELKEAALASEESFREVRTRFDTFLTLTLTVVAVLFAGLGIIATKAPDQPSFLSPPLWVAAVALFFALHAHAAVHKELRAHGGTHDWSWRLWLAPSVMATSLTAAAVIVCLLFYSWEAHISAGDISQAKQQISTALNKLDQEKKGSEARLDGLQRQVELLQDQVKKK